MKDGDAVQSAIRTQPSSSKAHQLLETAQGLRGKVAIDLSGETLDMLRTKQLPDDVRVTSAFTTMRTR